MCSVKLGGFMKFEYVRWGFRVILVKSVYDVSYDHHMGLIEIN